MLNGARERGEPVCDSCRAEFVRVWWVTASRFCRVTAKAVAWLPLMAPTNTSSVGTESAGAEVRGSRVSWSNGASAAAGSDGGGLRRRYALAKSAPEGSDPCRETAPNSVLLASALLALSPWTLLDDGVHSIFQAEVTSCSGVLLSRC